MADDQITGKVTIDIEDAKAALNQIGASLQQTQQQMQDGFKNIGTVSKDGSQTIQDSVKGISSSFGDMANQLKSGASGIASSFSSMLGPLGMIKTAVLEVTAVFAGLSAMLVSSAKDQDEWVRDSLAIARGFGITSQEASILKVAMEQLAATNLTGEVSTQMLLRAYNMFIQKFAQGGAEIEKWGVIWKGTGYDTFMGMIEKYQELDNATEKAQMRADFFGTRLGTTLAPALQNLSRDALEEARGKAEELGRVVGEDNVRASQTLSMATLHLHESWQELHSHLATVGIPLWAAVKEVMAAIVNIVNGVINGVKGIAGAMASAVTACESYAVGLGKVLEKMGRIITDSSSAESAIYAMQKAMAPGMGEPSSNIPSPQKDQPGAAPTKAGGGGGGGGEPTILQQWKNELDQLKLADKAFQDQSLAMEKAFWADKLSTGKTATKEQEEELKAQEKASQLFRLQQEQGFWKSKLTECAEGTKEYNAVQHEIVTLEQQANKLRLQSELDLIKSKIAANQASIKDQEARIDQETRLDKLDLAMKRENINYLGKISKLSKMEELQEYRALLVQEQAMDLQRAQQKAQLYMGDQVKYKDYLDKLEVLKKQQALDLEKIDDEISITAQSTWGNMVNSIGSAFSSGVGQMLQGTKDFATSLKQMFDQILQSFIKMVTDMVAKWLEAKTMMAAVSFFSGGIFHSGGEVFHAGGVVYAHSGLAPGEVPVIAQAGEWILNRNATRSLSNLGVNFSMLNAGQVPVLAAGGNAGAGAGGGGNTIHVNFAPNINRRMTQAEWHGEACKMLNAINLALQRFGRAPLSPSFT